MKISDRLNVLSQIVTLALFLYLSINSVIRGTLNFIELVIMGYGLLSSLIISIIAQIERIKGE
tara:strand:- start:88 stop:276 length:189 start_codon:yes stop_codon:yes gene_type:complete